MAIPRIARPGSLHRHAFCALLAACALAPLHAVAQTWPAKPVTVVVGVTAGGALDGYTRALADQLSKTTGTSFIVDNKPGANGNLSAEAVLKAPGDGYTLWIGTQSMVTINPAAFSQQRWKIGDFKPILKGVEAPLVLVTNPAVPAKTYAELADWIRKPENKAAYASFSPGTPSHFLGHQLNERLKADMVHIAYKGSSQQITDILGGQVPLGFTQLAVAVPHIQTGKLRAIAVTSAQRSRFLPQVPTLAELGYPELGTTIWFGLFAPANTPAPVLDAIRSTAAKVQADAGYRARLQALSFDVPDEAGAAFERSIASETARWSALVKTTGFKAED